MDETERGTGPERVGWLPSKRRLGASYLTGFGVVLVAFALGELVRQQATGFDGLVSAGAGVVLAGALLPMGPWLYASPLADEHVLTVSEAGALGLAIPTGLVLVAGLVAPMEPLVPQTGYLVSLMAAGTVVGSLVGALRALRREHDRRMDLFSRYRHLHRLVQHNIRDGMTMVMGTADLLADELDGASEDMVRSIRRQSRVIADLSESAGSLDALEERRTVDAVDVTTLVADLVEGLEEFNPDATIELHATDTDPVLTDDATVELAVWHLVDRALAADRAPTVEIAVEPTESGVVVRVTDDGPAPPAAALSAFADGDAEVVRDPAVVDAWLARWLVEEVGGSVTVDRRDGPKTTATITVPDGWDRWRGR